MRMMRLIAIIAALSLAGCAGRPGPELLRATASASVPGARIVTVYVATTRDRTAPDENVFTAGRSYNLNYAAFTISVPPNHVAGQIEWPQGSPDPHRTFATLDQRILDRASFEREVATKRGTAKSPVSVFVHGFNNNFQEALFRLVQIANDSDSSATPILFAWPSEATVTGYVADKDAATFSRDRLVEVLTMLGRSPDIGEITVTGHSMGGWLTVEALRQLRLTRQDAIIRRLKVFLAAPDIDVDVFRSQLSVIGPLSPPMTVLVSKDDVALSVSQFISGERQRLGTLDVDDPRVQEASKRANVQIVDISSLSANDGLNHNRFSELATLVPRITAQNANGQEPNLGEAGAFIFDAVGATLARPIAVTGKTAGGE
jgi:esterase/lipase superfamily enzyme